jgi:hypothetical protein
MSSLLVMGGEGEEDGEEEGGVFTLDEAAGEGAAEEAEDEATASD